MEGKRKGYGQKFIEEYEAYLKALQNNPFYQIRYGTIRCLPLKKFKYMIHFTVDEVKKTVYIYAVLSTYLNPKIHYIKSK